MGEAIDISELMGRLVAEKITPENLVACATRNLYSLKRSTIAEHKPALRNSVRACIAYVKLLYDFGQHMDIARTYLLHRIKLHEVREHDLHLENSIIRGLTPPTEDVIPLCSDASLIPNDRGCSYSQDKESDPELEIILDTRMIHEIDVSKAALQDISRRIEDKKNVLKDRAADGGCVEFVPNILGTGHILTGDGV